MRGRMVHGQTKDGKLFQESQDYDIKGRVCCLYSRIKPRIPLLN